MTPEMLQGHHGYVGFSQRQQPPSQQQQQLVSHFSRQFPPRSPVEMTNPSSLSTLQPAVITGTVHSVNCALAMVKNELFSILGTVYTAHGFIQFKEITVVQYSSVIALTGSHIYQQMLFYCHL